MNAIVVREDVPKPHFDCPYVVGILKAGVGGPISWKHDINFRCILIVKNMAQGADIVPVSPQITDGVLVDVLSLLITVPSVQCIGHFIPEFVAVECVVE